MDTKTDRPEQQDPSSNIPGMPSSEQPDDLGSAQVFITGLVAGILLVLVVMFLINLQQDAQEKGKNELVPSTTSSLTTGRGPSEGELKDSYSSLTIESVEPGPGSVTVRGTSDLPSGSVISVDLNVASGKNKDAFVGEHDHVRIEDGSFEVKLAVSPREEFRQGPFVITVLFTPRGQSDEVLAAVGSNGEKLAGELVDDKKAYQVLQTSVQMDLDLNMTAPVYKFDTPEMFPKTSPERTLALYIQAWKNKDWETMSTYASRTWLNDVDDPARQLELKHFYKVLLGFEVQSIERVSDVKTRIEYRIVYEDAIYNLYNREVNAVILKESAPGRTSATGTWGVDPNSTLREDVK